MSEDHKPTRSNPAETSWNEYRRLVLNEIERLSREITELNKKLHEVRNDDLAEVKMVVRTLADKLNDTKNDLTELDRKFSKDTVTQIEFLPYKRLINGLISMILVAVVAAALALIFKANDRLLPIPTHQTSPESSK